MKKTLLLSMLLAVGFFFANAQTLPIYDDCSSYPLYTINPAGYWKFVDVDADSTYGFQGTTFPNNFCPMAFISFDFEDAGVSYTVESPSGNPVLACFASTLKHSTGNNDWLISPLLPNNGNKYIFSFWAATYTDQYGEERFNVFYSTTGDNPSDFTMANCLNLPYTDVPEDWTKYTYEVPANAKYVAINCVSKDRFIFLVDDITLKELFHKNLEAYALGVPDYSCELTDQEKIQIGVVNEGVDTVYEFDVAYQISNHAPVVEHVTTTLLPDSSYIHTFATLADLTFAMDADSIRGWVVLPNDEFLGNDTTAWYGTGVPAPETVTYTNDFETEDQLKGWSIVDVDEDVYGWHYTTEDNGNKLFFCQTFNSTPVNDWLFSSCFDLQAGDYTLEFLYKAYSAIYTEKLNIYYGTTPDPASMQLIGSVSFSNENFKTFSQIFNIPADGIYYIGFKGASAASQGDIYLDNVLLKLAEKNDIAVVNHAVPALSCELTGAETIKMTVKNTGVNEITAFSAYYQVGNATPVVESVTETIASGAEYEYTFTTLADLTVPAIETVTLWAELANDNNADNDTITAETGLVASVTSYPYENKFTTEADILNWSTLNGLNNECFWNINTSGYWYHIGNLYYASMPQYSYYTGGEDFLVSSCMDFQAAKQYELSFDYAVYDPELTSSMKVYIGKKVSDNPSDYTLIDELTMFNNQDWQTYTNVFTVPEDGTYYIAFYAYNNQRSMFLDNFNIRDNVGINDNVNASSFVTLYPNPTKDMVNLRSIDNMSTVSVYDVFGKNIANYEVSGNEAQINVSNLASGLYVAKIATENGVVVKKFNVQK